MCVRAVALHAPPPGIKPGRSCHGGLLGVLGWGGLIGRPPPPPQAAVFVFCAEVEAAVIKQQPKMMQQSRRRMLMKAVHDAVIELTRRADPQPTRAVSCTASRTAAMSPCVISIQE